MKTVTTGLSVAGVQKMIDEVMNYTTWLKDRTQAFIAALADDGLNVAKAKFTHVEYSGKNDAKVEIQQRTDSTVAVVAIGESVLFIEFGTGVTYPDIHPEADELRGKNLIVGRGEYGKKHGKQTTWGYCGDPGNLGEVIDEETSLVLTHGSPASMPMYETVKELKAEVEAVARRIFV